MGWNIGLKDRIGLLSHSSGVITLAPSLLTIGGRQYKTTSVLSRTISADVTLVANTLYFVYATIISGVTSLRVSTSPPSAYLLLNPNSSLVSGFFSSGQATPAFGGLVNPTGVPRCDGPVTFDITPAFSTSNGTASVVPGTGTYTRIGNMVFYSASVLVTKGTATGSLGLGGMPFSTDGSITERAKVAPGTGNIFTGFASNQTFYAFVNGTSIAFVAVSAATGGINPIDATNMPAGQMNLGVTASYRTTGLDRQLIDL